VGLFEQADGGTLFLDEIGETPDEVQPMLLRVLETGTITPLGETRERALDVRVVAATDADLDGGAREGSFRRALLHRLAAYEIPVPPLRQRREDLPALFLHFLREELSPGDARLLDAGPESEELPLPTALMAALLDHPFPGNVRELRNLARRLSVASRGADRLAADALQQWLGQAQEAPGAGASASAAATGATQPPPRPSRRPAEIDDAALVAALEEHEWSPGRAASALGIPTSTLHDLMRKSPAIRRAKDIGDDELAQALSATDGDPARAAARLRVSERALRMTLKQRGKL
jgi:two-component system nitrogen regulation response regulator GlnG